VSAHRLIGVSHAGINQLEDGQRALVQHLNIFLRESDIDLEELQVKLGGLLDLLLGDVELLALLVGAANQAVIRKSLLN